MGRRKRDRQPVTWVTATNPPTAASHPFSRRLNQLLPEHGVDDFVETSAPSSTRRQSGSFTSVGGLSTFINARHSVAEMEEI